MVLFIRRVGVVGAGVMGCQIAEVMSLNGMEVVMMDISEDILNRALTRIEASLTELITFHKTKAEREVKRIEDSYGVKLTDDQKAKIAERLRPTYDEKRKAEAQARIRTSLNLEDLKNSDLVIEAVVEEPEIKKKTFAELDKVCPSHAIFATNTSSLSISELASATKRKGRFLGLHFFNPSTTLPLVEVIPGLDTSENLVGDVMDWVSGLRNHRYPLQPIRVKEVPGFLVNRILGAMLNEAYACYEEGVASMRDIDLAMRAGAGMPLGPFELTDMVGVDVIYHVDQAIKGMQGGNTMPKPIHIIRKMYHAGRWGRKTGRGFYEYP